MATKKADVIANEFPEGVKAPSKFELKIKGTRQANLGFLTSDDLEVVENGIKDTVNAVDRAILAICLAVYKIQDEGLYKQAGFEFYLDYFENAEGRLNLPAATVSNYRHIGEVYTKHRHQLRAAGFNEQGSAHKLRYLDEALKNHPEDEVWNHVVSDSLRTFRVWAENESSIVNGGQESNPVKVEVTGTGILVNGVNVLNVPKELPAEERDKLKKRLKEVYRIEAAGNLPYIVETQSPGEQRAIDNFLKKFRAGK